MILKTQGNYTFCIDNQTHFSYQVTEELSNIKGTISTGTVLQDMDNSSELILRYVEILSEEDCLSFRIELPDGTGLVLKEEQFQALGCLAKHIAKTTGGDIFDKEMLYTEDSEDGNEEE